MTRKAVQDLSAPSAIRPVASPVNTYVRPAEPAPSKLHQLADGLSSFDKGLSDFLTNRREKQNEADRIRGEAAFNQANQVGWAEAVKQGRVPANASPVFQKSYKQAQGNLAGIKLRERYNAAYLSWEGRNSDDPAAFDKFFQDFVSSNIGTDDPHILAGLQPHIRKLQEDAYSVWGSEVGEATYRGNVNTQAALAGETIDYANTDGLATGDGTDYEGLRGDLLSQREEVLKTGVRMEDYDAAMVKAIAAKAIEHQDPQLLNILDEVLPGYDEGVKLSSLPQFRDIKQTTIEKIETDVRVRMNDNAKVQKAADKKAEGAIVRNVFTILDQDPTAEIPEDVIKQWEKYDPEARTKLARARKSLQDADALESREDLLMIEQMIQNGANQKDIFDLVADGVISDPITLRTSLDRVEKRQNALFDGKGTLRSATARRILSIIKERTTDPLGEVLFMPGGLSDEGLEATRAFEMMLIEWEANNPNATLEEREQKTNEFGDLVLKRIYPAISGEQGPQYLSAKDAEQLYRKRQQEESSGRLHRSENASSLNDNGEPDDVKVTEDRPGADSASVSQEDGSSFWRLPSREEFYKSMQIDAGIRIPREKDVERRRAWENAEYEKHFSGDQPPNFEDLDPAIQDMFETNGKALGMTPEEFTLEYWKKLKEIIDRKSGEAEGNPQAETIEGNLHKSSLSAEDLQGDVEDTIETAVQSGTTKTASASQNREVQRVSTVLDLLGQTEGTDKGDGYNETLAYGLLTDGDVDLVNMTLGDLDKLQTNMLRHPANKWDSSAVGRYQIVRTTLRKLKTRMGLTDDMKFTPELQDRMALELLRGRGLDKWMSGKKSDKSFMNALAREWASMPTSSGRGYYGGQRAAMTVQGVLNALNGVRNFSDDQTQVATIPVNKPGASA